MGNFINSSLLGDNVVKEAISCQISRESQWSTKSSTILECRDIFNQISETCFIPTIENTIVYETAARIELPKLKKAASNIIAQNYLDKSNDKADNLTMQGEFAKLLAEEQNDVDWKSLIYQVPRGVMAFAARVTTNSLATPDNLARWGKIGNTQCKICNSAVATLGHLISGCKDSLYRFTFRHDSILAYLHDSFTAANKEGFEIYTDLEGCKVNGGTIPPDIIVTDAVRPDMVIINRRASPVVELTVS